MGKIKDIDLSLEQIRVLENGYKQGRAYFLRQRCLAVLLRSKGLSSPKIAEKVDLCQQSINKRVDRFMDEGIEPSRSGRQADHQQGSRRRNDTPSYRIRPAECESSKSCMGSIFGQNCLGRNVQGFLSALAQDIDV